MSSQQNCFAFQRQSYRLRAGYTSNIRVTARVRESDPEEMRGFSVEDRGCLLEDEHKKPSQFSTYREDTCLYECSMSTIKKQHGCVPWDIPFDFQDGESDICSGKTAAKFKEDLGLFNASLCQACLLPACNDVSYTASVSHRPCIELMEKKIK